MVTCTPVLRYYNLQEEVTLQCDASQSGLGAALMQNGQPIAYASRALTPTETRYAQIEKELLAIVFACDRFDAYVYGQDLVKRGNRPQAFGANLHETTRRNSKAPTADAVASAEV